MSLSSFAALLQDSLFLSFTQLHTFSTPLPLKLDDDNYLIWQQQNLEQVRSYKLLPFLDESTTLMWFLTLDDVVYVGYDSPFPFPWHN